MSVEHGVFRSMRAAEAPAERDLVRDARVEERLARRGGWVELLRAPALLFRAITGARNALYDRRWLSVERVEAPVVSVGNITAGGTGKTPMTIWLARRLALCGRRPGILSRGFGARAHARPGAAAQSDEVELIVRALPDVPHVVDPNRVRGARELARRGLDVVIVDDGFQHRRLARDLDLALVDATRPWGLASSGAAIPVRALLPRGLLRESPAGLARATAIVLTRTDQAEPAALAALRAELEELAPGVPLVETSHRCSAVRDDEGWLLSPEALSGREVDLVSGLGHPAAFEQTVRQIGARVVQHRAFPDHHAYRPGDLEGLGLGGRALVTTAKDAVKLEALGRAFWTVEVDLAVGSGKPVLEALLDALPQSRAARERAALHEGLHG